MERDCNFSFSAWDTKNAAYKKLQNSERLIYKLTLKQALILDFFQQEFQWHKQMYWKMTMQNLGLGQGFSSMLVPENPS